MKLQVRVDCEPADTSEFIPTGMSVTEGTTRHLSNSGQKVDR